MEANVTARRRVVAAAVVLVALATALLVFAWPDGGSTEGDLPAAVEQAIADVTPGPAFSAQVFATIVPSLVIVATGAGTAGDDASGLGSGVIINEDGSILTAHHVIAEAEQIEVIFADGTRATAVVASSEPENDIATLMPTERPAVVVPAVIGSSREMHIGDEAYAVGNPLGLIGSLSAGVISGLDRAVPIGDDQTLSGLIQFDAVVNPGSSGGPLLNRDGHVIGIVTALADTANDGGFSGIGFAVPIGTAVSSGGAGPAQ